MPNLNIPYIFTPNTTAASSEVNANFNSVKTLLNITKLDSTNIQSGAITQSLIAANAVSVGQLNSAAADGTSITLTPSGLSVASGGIDVTKLAASVVARLTPPGSIVAFGGDVAPSGWLLCNGKLLLKTDYADLYNAIGTNWGSDTALDFRLPDLRGQFLRGVDPFVAYTATHGAGVDQQMTVTGGTTLANPNSRLTAPGMNIDDLYTGQRVYITSTTVTNIGNNTYYFLIKTGSAIKFATTRANAMSNTPITGTAAGQVGFHTFNDNEASVTRYGQSTVVGADPANTGAGSIELQSILEHNHNYNNMTAPSSFNAVAGQATVTTLVLSQTGAVLPLHDSARETSVGRQNYPMNAAVNYIIKV